MAGVTYSGKFEDHINELYSPKNIGKTAKKFNEDEKKTALTPSESSQSFWCRRRKTGPKNWALPAGTTGGKSIRAIPRRSATR